MAVLLVAILTTLAAACGLASGAATPGVVAIFYSTQWQPAFIHYNSVGTTWNSIPGLALLPSGNPSYPADSYQYVEVLGDSLQFVFTDGHGNWDNNGGNNYMVSSAGEYVIANGQMTTLSTVGPAAYDRKFPSMILSNWKDAMMTWSGPRDNPNESGVVRASGMTSLRCSANWTATAFTEESFGLMFNDVAYTDAHGWDGPAGIQADGEFYNSFDSYNNADLPFELTRSYFMPPNQDFVIVQYTLGNSQQSATVKFFEYAAINPEAAAAASATCSDSMCTVSGDVGFAMGVFYEVDSLSASVAGLTGVQTQFRTKQTLDSSSAASGSSVTVGFATSFTIDAGQSVTWYSFRAVGGDASAAAAAGTTAAQGNGEDWVSNTNDAYAAFLKRAEVQPTLDGDAQTLYENSLVILKNSQNPTLGTMVASFHPAYDFKVWGRDGLFAAMIMDSVGYHDEAAAYLRWMATAQMRDNNEGFHTCYSLWTGEVVGFVEPQLDSAGAFPLAAYHHYVLTKDTQLLSDVLPRISALESFFISQVGPHGLAPPDYSIWEESSSGITGLPLPTSYFAFSQSLAQAGLWAASQIETILGNDNQAQQDMARSNEIAAAIESQLWMEDAGFYARGIWSNTYTLDARHDSASVAVVWSGATKNQTRISSHLAAITANLTVQAGGLSRYTGDPFFFDSKFNPGGQEVGAAAPPWGVVTCFTAWAELSQGTPIDERLSWMVDHAAPGAMPVGEAVDGVTGTFVMTSCPDIYEYAGVYVWTVLMDQQLADLPNPRLW